VQHVVGVLCISSHYLLWYGTNREELEDWGVANLIGTNMLKAYMHGFFMDMKLYVTLKGHGGSSEPQSYQDWVKAQVKKKIEAKRESTLLIAFVVLFTQLIDL
jgi:hypothetical protein